MNRCLMLVVMCAAAWLAIEPSRGWAQAGIETPAAAAPKRPTGAKPTPADKIERLRPLPYHLVGNATYWGRGPEVTAERRWTGEVLEIADGYVTLFDGGLYSLRGDTYVDVPLDDLLPMHRAVLERIDRLRTGKEVGDERLLLGSWEILPREGGEQVKSTANRDAEKGAAENHVRDERIYRSGSKLVVTGSDVQFLKLPNVHYVIDETTTPKSLRSDLFAGIYELNGDELRLCLAAPGAAAAPTKFEVREGQDVLVLRRLPDVSKLPAPAADAHDAELKAYLEKLLALFIADNFEGAMKELMPPQDWARIPPQKQVAALNEGKMQKAKMISMLTTLLRVPPKMSADGLSAEFDLSRVHAAYFGALPKQTMRKVGGRWQLN